MLARSLLLSRRFFSFYVAIMGHCGLDSVDGSDADAKFLGRLVDTRATVEEPFNLLLLDEVEGRATAFLGRAG